MVKQAFIDTLKEGLEPHGFKYQSSKSQFSKKAGNREFLYRVEVSNGHCDIYLKILLPEVEAIKKAAWGSNYERFASVGDNLLNIARDRPLMHFWDDAAAKERAQSEVEFFNSFVLDYYAKHSDTAYLDRLLNDTPGEHPNVCYNELDSACLGLVVAYLHRRERLEEQIELYLARLIPMCRKMRETQDINHLDEFERLAAYLRKEAAA